MSRGNAPGLGNPPPSDTLLVSSEMPCPGESPALSGVYRQTGQQPQGPGSCPECYTNQTFVFDDGSSSSSSQR